LETVEVRAAQDRIELRAERRRGTGRELRELALRQLDECGLLLQRAHERLLIDTAALAARLARDLELQRAGRGTTRAERLVRAGDDAVHARLLERDVELRVAART